MYSGGIIAANRRRTGSADIWGEAWEEALIDPVPSTERSTYVFGTKYELLATADVVWLEVDEGGPYWPCALLKSLGELPSDYPVDAMVYYSTDHSSTAGGISVLCGMRDAGEPTLFQWLDYDDAVTAGWFASIGSKPASGPLFDETGNQVETPYAYYDGTSFYLYAQVLDASGGRGQDTILYTSSDGLNWTSPVAAQFDVSSAWIGDGHTGYFEFGPNIFPGVAGNYIGSSLAAGSSKSYLALWSADNPEGPWTRVGFFGAQGGRAADDLGGMFIQRIFYHTARKTRQGYSCIARCSGLSAGGDTVEAILCEVLLDENAIIVQGMPIPILSSTAASFDDPSITQPCLKYDAPNDRRMLFYRGSTTAPTDSIGLTFDTDLRNPGNTFFDPLDPVLPAPTLERTHSFELDESLPAWLTTDFSGSGSHEFNGNGGLELIAPASAGRAGVFGTDTFTPGSINYLDIWLEECEPFINNNAFLIMAAISSSTAAFTSRAGMTLSPSTKIWSFNQNHTSSTSFQTTRVPILGATNARMNIGMRWIPADNRMMCMFGTYGMEMETKIDASFAAPAGSTWRPCFGITSTTGTRWLFRNIRYAIG